PLSFTTRTCGCPPRLKGSFHAFSSRRPSIGCIIMHGVPTPIQTTARSSRSGTASSDRGTKIPSASTCRSASKAAGIFPSSSCCCCPSGEAAKDFTHGQGSTAEAVPLVVSVEATRADAGQVLNVELCQGRPRLVIEIAQTDLRADALGIHHFPKPQLQGIAAEDQFNGALFRSICLPKQYREVFLVLMHLEDVQTVFKIDPFAQEEPERCAAERHHGRPLELPVVNHEVHPISHQKGRLGRIVVEANAAGANHREGSFGPRAPGGALNETPLQALD